MEVCLCHDLTLRHSQIANVFAPGPHIGLQNAWPMSRLIQAQTSDNDAEILECINMVLNSCKLGLVHESVDVNFAMSYTSEFPTKGS